MSFAGPILPDNRSGIGPPGVFCPNRQGVHDVNSAIQNNAHAILREFELCAGPLVLNGVGGSVVGDFMAYEA